MGEAAQTLAVDNDTYDVAIACRRPSKPLRDSRHRAGNLIAFEPFRGTDTFRKTAALTADLEGATRVQTALPGIDITDLLLSHLPTINEPIYHRLTRLPFSKVQTRIAAGVSSVILIGIIIAGVSTSMTILQQADFEPVVQVTTSPSQSSQPQDSLSGIANTEPSVTDPLSQELQAALQLIGQYEEKIQRSNDENDRLLDNIKTMEAETTSLNYELLQLDLALAMLTTEAEADVEPRTVYKSVDVSIGSGVDNGEVLPYNDIARITIQNSD